MYYYVYREYGVDGVKCLITHYIADLIENLLRKGFKDYMIISNVKELTKDYITECSYHRDKCVGMDVIMKELINTINPNLGVIIDLIRKWVHKKELPLDILINASTDILSFILRVKLYLKGYRGRSGSTVNRYNLVRFLVIPNHYLG